MTRVLLVGKSQGVLTETVALLGELGHEASATNRFEDVMAEFDPRHVDLVVFGGAVPVELREQLKVDIAARNPDVVFVHGLVGIPGLIADQVVGAANAHLRLPDELPTYDAGRRAIQLNLAEPREVTVTAWWQTSFVPPDPKSHCRVLVDGRLGDGTHVVELPADIPDEAAFATIHVERAVHAFRLAAQPSPR